MPTLNLGFLASHGGSNMQAIIDSIKSGKLDAKPCVLISNNSKSGAIEKAIREGMPYYHISSLAYPDPDDLDRAIISTLDRHGVDTIVLAGYMKKIGPEIIHHFNGRILNIHPALLPKFGGPGMYGIKVHEAVIASGEKFSGATIHLVDDRYDHGRILAQKQVELSADETPDSLAEKVLKAEHILYSSTLQMIAAGEINI